MTNTVRRVWFNGSRDTAYAALETRTEYPYGTDGYSVTTDPLGVQTVTRKSFGYNCETEETASAGVTNRTTKYWGGATVEEKYWDGKWTRETRSTSYNANGCRVETVTAESSDYPAVTKSVTVRDFLGRAVSVTTPLTVTSNFYDGASDLVIRVSRTGSPDALYVYDEQGNVTATALDVDGDGQVSYAGTDRIGATVTEYEELSNEWWRVTSSADSVGGVTNALTVTREQLTGLSPALLGRTVTLAPDGTETVVTRAFEPGTDVIVETSRTGAAAPSTRRTLYGHELESAGPDSATLSTYDGFGRAVSQTVTNGAGTVSTSAVVYDNLGNAVTNTTIYGDLTAVTSTGYDSQGRAVSRTDALGNAVTNAYDSLGLTLSLSGATYPVQYAYDTVGRQTELNTTRDGLAWDKTRFLFDGATGLLTNKVYADGSRVVYAYTDVGRLASRTWARNIVTTYAYDALGQLVNAACPDAQCDVFHAYDVFGYASASSNSFAQYTFLNSLNGTATNETAVIGTNAFTLARRLDGHNRVVALTVDGTETVYDYDAESRVEGVTRPEATTVYAYTNGLSFGYTLTLTNGGTVTRALIRDPYRRHLIVSVSNLFNGVFMRGVEYGHDLTGRRTGRVDSSPAVSATNAFLYNICSEVTNAVFDAYASAYSYDTIGNRVWSVENAVTNTYSANNLNQYIGLSYDADGNLLSDGSLSHTWDPENRLVRSEPAGIATNGAVRLVNRYDHRHRRIQKCVEVLTGRGAGYPMDPSQPGSWDAVKTHTFVYDGWKLALETIAHTNGTVDRIEYVWGLDLSGTLQGAGGVGGLLFEKRNGQIYIPLYDANGNVTDYVDAYGTVRGHFEYDAFGNTVAMWGDLVHSFKFRFSTKYWDDETRSYYYGYRHYAPKLGCWLSRDPIEEMGGVGLYGFVGNNAIVFVDALGQNKFCAKCCPNKCRIGEIQLDQMTIFITATGKPSIDAAGSINLLEQSLVLTKAAVITFLQGPAAATGDALANVFSISASSVAGRIASLINENAFERLGAGSASVLSVNS